MTCEPLPSQQVKPAGTEGPSEQLACLRCKERLGLSQGEKVDPDPPRRMGTVFWARMFRVPKQPHRLFCRRCLRIMRLIRYGLILGLAAAFALHTAAWFIFDP